MAQRKELPGDRLIESLKKGGTGLRDYIAPDVQPRLGWWARRRLARQLQKEAEESLKPKIVHTPTKPAQPR